MTHYDSIKRGIDRAIEALRDAGMSDAHLEDVRERLAVLAGSYLPPVSGRFEIKLGDLRKV